MKKILAVLTCLGLLLGNAWAEEKETIIELSDTEILVDGIAIAQETSASVYLSERIEVHEDVPEDLKELSNRIVTITDAGVYRFSGTASDIQIAVRADEDDEVHIILDGVDIVCRTAPAIAIHSAVDERIAGEYGVTIELADDSANNITGAHTEAVEEDDIKLSGAITSLVSIGFEGNGFLNVDGDNEGIEVKFGHMTFDGGNIQVSSADDPLNASEDGISVITINDGTLHVQVKPDKGGEGDGVDSNGSIIINGGALASYAHPDSMDSGIDSDLGCIINGGVVLGAGNMYDEISNESGQLFMALQFAQKTDDMIVVTTTDGTLVAVSEENDGYTSFVFSSPKLAEGDYYLYLGGELEMLDGEMQYIPGRQLQHGGSAGGGFGRGPMPGMPGEMERPEGMPEPPEGFEFPGDMSFPEDMQPPQMDEFEPEKMPGGRDFGRKAEPAALSTTFHLAPGSTMFSGITVAE